MKIGLVMDTTLDGYAGVQQYFKGLARFLLSKGHDIRFLVPPSRDTHEFQGKIISFGRNINPAVNVTSVPIAFGFGGVKQIREVLERERFDIIHISAPFSPFFGAKVVSEAKCPVVSSYVIFTMNKLYKIGAVLLRLFMTNVYRKIDMFIAVSEAAKKEAEIIIPGDYRLIPIGLDLKKFSTRVKPIGKFKKDKPNILFLGRLERRKGVDYLINAFQIVKKQLKDVRLIIVGDGPERKSLESLVQNLGLKDVVFEGAVSEKLKPRYYARADLCVFPAYRGESFGIVLIEAMATGKVTIGFSNEGYSFVLKNLPDLLVENKNTRKLAKKIISILQSRKLKRLYERRCLKEAQNFSWEVVGDQILNIYKRLVNSKS